MKTGEVLYEKVFMSPRPPPKISLKHEWKRKLGSEVARQPEGEVSGQPEGEVARQAKFVQSTQPTPNPIRERSVRPGNMQDGRNTYRSQEIDVNSFCEEPSSSERTVRLVETDVIQTRSSEDRKDLNVEQTHERTGRPVDTHNTADVKDSSRVRSSHESETFNDEDEVLHKRMERSVADHDVSHAVNDGERGRHGLPNSRTTTFRCEIRAKYQRSTIDSEN